MLLLIYPQITLAEDKNLEIERGKATTYRVMAEFVVYEIKPLDIQETRKYKEEREKKEKEEQKERERVERERLEAARQATLALQRSSKRNSVKTQTASNSSSQVVSGWKFATGNCTWYAAKATGWTTWRGNAREWPGNARAQGYLVDKNPVIGSIYAETWLRPPYGHVAIIQEVYTDGSFLISEMNYKGFNIISTRLVPFVKGEVIHPK